MYFDAESENQFLLDAYLNNVNFDDLIWSEVNLDSIEIDPNFSLTEEYTDDCFTNLNNNNKNNNIDENKFDEIKNDINLGNSYESPCTSKTALDRDIHLNNSSCQKITNKKSNNKSKITHDTCAIKEPTKPNNEKVGGKLYDGEPTIRNFRNKKWKCNQKTIDYNLNNNELSNFFEAENCVSQFFKEIYDDNIRDIDSNYFIQYVMNHDSFTDPIRSFYMRRKDFDSPSIMHNQFESVMQSRKPPEDSQLNNRFRVIFNIIENKQISGGMLVSKEKNKRVCKQKIEVLNQRDYIQNSRSVKIINSDNYCLLRAILVGKAYADKEKNAKLLTRKNNRKLNSLVKKYVSDLNLPDRHLNLDDLKIIDDHLNDYQITLYSSISDGSSILYPEKKKKHKKVEKFINITFENDHFNTITSMTAYLKCSYFCQFCRVKYQNLGSHNCNSICKSCSRSVYICKESPEEKKEFAACGECFIVPENKACKFLHETSQCLKLKLCHTCGNKKSKSHPHVCGENHKWCPNCKSSVDFEHRCFIKKVPLFEEKKKSSKALSGMTLKLL